MQAVLSRDNAVNSIRAFLAGACEDLARSGVSSARLDAELLLAHALGVRRETIHAHPERRLDEQEHDRARRLIDRRAGREPVAYILGRKEFMGLEFAVTPDTLIPRWETEGLVAHFCEWIETVSFPRPLRLLDLGTGSGNIAVCLAKRFPQSRIIAADVCANALDVAKANATRHGVAESVRFVLSDWLENIEGEHHAILCNPPYIDEQRMATLMPDVCDHEPVRALNGGERGLEAYRRLIPDAHARLVSGGGLFLEIGEDQADAVGSLIESHRGYSQPSVMQDLSGSDRIVFTQRRIDG